MLENRTAHLGMVGLGRMGAAMVQRLMRDGHACAVHDIDRERTEALAARGAHAADSLAELASALAPPRVVWMMLPAGPATGHVTAKLMADLDEGDLIVDGGNSHYLDTVERAALCAQAGIQLVDAGVSGGVWGLEQGYCLMLGGHPEAVRQIEPICASLAPGPGDTPRTPGRSEPGTAECGYLHCGPSGAGHFVKMVHNAIEYGTMQALAEGLDLLRDAGEGEHLPAAQRYPELPLAEIAELWRRGSVIRSWLLDLTAAALHEDVDLSGSSSAVQDSGSGRWALTAGLDRSVPLPALSSALFARFQSRREDPFAGRLLTALRARFGGHGAGSADADR